MFTYGYRRLKEEDFGMYEFILFSKATRSPVSSCTFYLKDLSSFNKK